jgi:perosamine synthetase
MQIRNKRILVTGGAGFIGSELVRQAAETAAEVLVVDNLVNGRRENLAGLPSHVRFVESDIRETAEMRRLLDGVDAVFHLACLGVRHSIHSPRENHDVNATATLDLLAAARSAGVGRFVYVSTSEVYGTARWAPMTEEHPTYPKTVYGASKLAGECHTRAYFDTYGYPTVVVRPFNTYGPRCHHEGDSGEVIPKFMLRGIAGKPMVVFGDGTQTRDFSFVSDTARGILLAGSADAAVGETVNLGNGREITIGDLAGEVGRVLGIAQPLVEHIEQRPGDVLRLYADMSKAKTLCGYQPAVSFAEGLAKLRDWYLAQGVAAETLLEQERVRNWETASPAAESRETAAFVPVARPLMGEPEAKAARRPIIAGWVTQGPEVAAFEKEFAEYTGAPHACALSSCTTALHLALAAAGVGPGDEVITVSHSYIATANSVRYCGATPVFVDIEPETFNIDAARAEEAITPQTKAILCVHQVGMPCDLAALVPLARKHGIALIEDAACAIGSEILWDGKWERIGRPHGDAACFSFHPRKLVSTGDGGMITTSNEAWDQRFRLLRQHAMSVPDTVRHGSRDVIFESYPELGYNYRMTDIQAAVGREQLKRLPEILGRRRHLAARYSQALAAGGLTPPVEPSWARTNWQSYTLTLPEGADQREVMQAMLDEGIATRRGVMCSHREAAYAGAGGAWPLRNSEAAQDRNILLPLYHQLTEDQQDRVIERLGAALRVPVKR